MEIQVPEWLSRTEQLIGNEKLTKLKNSHVLIAGLGGVGGYAAEMICRAGVGTLSIADGDIIQPSNRNRQILALKSLEGTPKVRIMGERLMDINPDLKLNIHETYIKDEAMLELLSHPYDYVVDAIDTLSPKFYFIFHSLRRKYRLVSSMGSGGKLDPTLIRIGDISESYNCPLAKLIRKRLHKFGIKTGFKVVYSAEDVPLHAVKEISGEQNKKSIIGTISYIPAVFGCYMASVVINDLIGS